MNEVTAIDVGQYIVDCFRNQNKSITTLKLQKLVYYSQSWSLVWDDAPLFEEDFEAWVNGPVAVSLFHALQGYYYCPADIPNARRNVLIDILPLLKQGEDVNRGNIFHYLCLDKEHAIYKVEKKHT